MNVWQEEDCSEKFWRDPCDWELEGDGCGWIYLDYSLSVTWEFILEFNWVSCDDWSSWDSCKDNTE